MALAMVVLVAIGIAGWSIYSYSTDGTPASANSTMYICTATHRTFPHRNQLGETLPILSPFSGKHTGLPAEACYWTADGEMKTEPTWVLLNEAIHDPAPTFCPDCGRLVVGHNPRPVPGMRPPPTKSEWEARTPRPQERRSDR